MANLETRLWQNLSKVTLKEQFYCLLSYDNIIHCFSSLLLSSEKQLHSNYWTNIYQVKNCTDSIINRCVIVLG